MKQEYSSHGIDFLAFHIKILFTALQLKDFFTPLYWRMHMLYAENSYIEKLTLQMWNPIQTLMGQIDQFISAGICHVSDLSLLLQENYKLAHFSTV